MFDRLDSGELSSVLSHIALLATWDVLPLLLLAYCRQLLLARHVSDEFSLRRSEAAELDRAVALYGSVCSRLEQIDGNRQTTSGFWNELFAPPVSDRDVAEECEDLKAHAHHLRETIFRLRSLPLQRLRAWVHIMSLRAALGRALAAHAGLLAGVLLAFHFFAQSASAHELIAMVQRPFVWYPLDKTLFQANAAGAVLAALVIPAFYLFRRAGLRREFGLEFRVLKQLAATPPSQTPECVYVEADTDVHGASVPADDRARWFTILGVAPSATVDEVRQAYKALIKQCHPDRVHDMSPTIRQFAETEARRVNAAYEEALSSLG